MRRRKEKGLLYLDEALSLPPLPPSSPVGLCTYLLKIRYVALFLLSTKGPGVVVALCSTLMRTHARTQIVSSIGLVTFPACFGRTNTRSTKTSGRYFCAHPVAALTHPCLLAYEPLTRLRKHRSSAFMPIQGAALSCYSRGTTRLHRLVMPVDSDRLQGGLRDVHFCGHKSLEQLRCRNFSKNLEFSACSREK